MNPTTFIIVDDDAINNMVCKMAIERHFGPSNVYSYQDPNAALEAISLQFAGQNRPVVIFLDLSMPHMSGWDFLERFTFLDAIPTHYTIFILSGSTQPDDKVRAESHPMVSGFISKSLTEKKLAEAFRGLPEIYGVRCFA